MSSTQHILEIRGDTKRQELHCGPSPDPPDRRDSLLEEKKERKSLCFPVLKNPPPVRNGVVWSGHLLFIFIFLKGEN